MKLRLFALLPILFCVSLTWAEPAKPGAEVDATKPPKATKDAPAKGNPGERLFQRFDEDGDGKVLLADLPAPVAERAKNLDKDGDGTITKDEVASARPGKPGKEGKRPDLTKLFQKLDANQDGKLEGDEIPERLKKNLARFDKNEDGAIDESEASNIRGGKQDRPGPAGGPPLGQIMERLKTLDTDGDGKVPLADLPDFAKNYLGRADADGDGMITMQEVETFGSSGLPSAGKPGPGLMSADALLENFDGNNDGKLSKEELAVIPGLPLERLDADGDGELTREEIDAKMKMAKKVVDARRGQGDGAGRAKKLFNDQDANADGRVSKEEAKGPLADKFDTLDANSDGQLDAEEVENGLPPKNEKKEPKKKPSE